MEADTSPGQTDLPELAHGDNNTSDTPRPEWGSLKRYWLAAIFLLIALFAVFPFVSNGYIALPDEGVYNAQAASLADGSWKTERPAADFDIDGAMDPLVPSAISGTMRLPYHRHPLYPLIIAPAFLMFGPAGTLLVSVIAGWVSAILIGFIARQFDLRYGIPAMYLAAAGTPMLWSSYFVAGHTIVIALSAFAVLLSMHAVSTGKYLTLAPLAASAFLIPQIRSEGAIFVASISLALLILGITPLRKFGHSSRPTFLTGIVVGFAGVAGYLTDAGYTSAISSFDTVFYGNPARDLGGRPLAILEGTWIALFQPWYSALTAGYWLPVIAVLMLSGVLASRFIPQFGLLATVLFSSAAIASFGFTATNSTLVTGLFAACPLLLFALFWMKKPQFQDSNALLLILSTLFVFIGIILTIYGDGGSAQWGGRFFQIALPMLVPLTVIGIRNWAQGVGRQQRRIIGISLVIVALMISTASLRENRSRRQGNKALSDEVRSVVDSTRADRSTGSGPLLTIIAQQPATGEARALWQHDTELNLLSVDFRLLFTLLSDSDFGKYDRVLVMSSVSAGAFDVLNMKLASERGIDAKSITSDRSERYIGYVYTNLPRS